MQLPHQPSGGRAGHAGAGLPRSLLIACAGFGLLAVLAWVAPAEKQGAVLGRYNYAQFMLVIGITLAAVSAFALAFTASKSRRTVGFPLAAIWFGGLVGWLLVEAIARFLPVRNQMDNPWYFAAGGGVSESEELPFERPAHLHWQGLSRGDLALAANTQDPDARMITFETDHEGFRNSTDIRQADVVVLGDSFAEAGNVPEAEAFSTLIGRKLNLKSRNLARAGYSPPVELVVLKRFGVNCRPKIVVWQIAESNDLDDAGRYQGWVDAGRPRYFDAGADRQWQRSKAWEQRSPTYWLFKRLRRPVASGWPYDGRFRDSAGVEHTMRFLSLPRLNFPAARHPGWPVLARALEEGAALCRSNQIRLVIVFIPDKYHVLGPYTRMLDPGLATPPREAFEQRSDSFAGLVGQLCANAKIPFVNATSELTERTKAGEIVYLPYDTHLSPRGHQIVADLVVEQLEQ